MSCGFTPPTAMPTMRASGSRPRFERLLLAHEQRGGDAVVGRAGVAGGDDDLLVAEALEPVIGGQGGELLGGGAGPHALVAIEEDRLAALLLDPVAFVVEDRVLDLEAG